MPRAPEPKKLPGVIRELVEAGLWIPTENGYEIHDFLKYNMSRARWEALKESGRQGGQRSGESRRGRNEAPAEAPASAGARPKPKQTPSRTEAPPEHDHDHEERSKKPPSVGLTGRGDVRPLTEDEEDQFSADSAGEKAMRILADERQAELLQPHLWPEVRELIGIFAQATSTEQRILPYEHDPGVRAVVLLLAKFDLSRLRVGVPLAVSTDWWREKPGRPLSNLSDTVLANALAEDAELAKVEAQRLANLKRFAVPRRASQPPLPAADAIQLANDALKKISGLAAGGAS
jgi:hypothetical protein